MGELTFRQWRQSEGFTQKDAAKIFDTSYVSISHWETKKPPSLRGKQVLDIFKKTKGLVTPNSLFGITADMQNEMERLRAAEEAAAQ